jgi:hypothetical protein
MDYGFAVGGARNDSSTNLLSNEISVSMKSEHDKNARREKNDVPLIINVSHPAYSQPVPD